MRHKALPTFVLVTGAPGSGKTTLSRAVAARLRLPVLARDDIRTGLFFTAGGWTETPSEVPSTPESIESFFRLLHASAQQGMSCVVDHVFRRDRPEELDGLTGVARCVVVQTVCASAIDRFAARQRSDPLLTRTPVLSALGFSTIDDAVAASVAEMRQLDALLATEFELPTITVDTSDGYKPGLDAIVDFVVDPVGRGAGG